MESSSESAASNDSFLWVDTSNDSSDDSTSLKQHPESMALTKMDGTNLKSKRNKKYSSGNEPNYNGSEFTLKTEKHNDDYRKPKMETIENENNVDLPMKKLKRKRSHHTSHTEDDDDSYLNLKVKQEDTSQSSSPVKKHQDTSKHTTTNDFSNTNNNEDVNENLFNGDQESDGMIVRKSKKKKKKSKRQYNSDNDHNDNSNDIKLEENETFTHQDDQSIENCEPKYLNNHSSSNKTDIDLDIKVEQENISTAFIEPKHKMRKKKNSDIDRTYSGDNEIDSLEINNPSEPSRGTSKKNKTKSYKNKSEENDDDHIFKEDKLTVEETVVGFPRKQHETIEDASADDSYNDISAIKGDDDHHLQTTLFSNKSMENDIGNRNNASDSEASTNENNKTGKTQRRISERLVFEDDDVSMTSADAISSILNLSRGKSIESKSIKLNNYLKKNPNLESISTTLNQDAVITKDDHLWLVKCTRDIDLGDLSGVDLKLDGVSKIKINGLSYESSITEEKDDRITVLSMEHTKYKLKNLPMHGIITIRKRLPKLHINNDSIMINNQTNFIPLPETKCRHPLLGIHYKKALKIVERLKVSHTEPPITYKKKKKLQKNSPRKDIEEAAKTEVEPARKRKKKQKEVDDEAPAPKKKKRRKHNPETAEAWESEKAIEENLFNF